MPMMKPDIPEKETLVLFGSKGAFWDLFTAWFLRPWYTTFTHEEQDTIHGASEPVA